MNRLSPNDYETVEALASALLPSDDTPGAADTPVVCMVLGAVKGQPPERLARFRSALARVDELARGLHGDVLARLPPPAREQVLARVATLPELAWFWHTLRTLLVLNFYSIPKVHRALGLPGPSIDLGGLAPPGERAGGARP